MKSQVLRPSPLSVPKVHALTSSPFDYEPALDGLRAISVIVVLGFHAGIPFLHGGFLGVDVFFVLSGFLITSLLVAEIDRNGQIDVRNFYIRRVLRLMPALLLLLGAFVVVGYFIWPLPRAQLQAVEALIALFNGANWVRAFDLFPMDYFGHMWSLSIEEQFYLLWPILLVVMVRRVEQRRTLVGLILLLALVACAWRAALWFNAAPVVRLYNGLDTHADGLLLGSALGVARASGLLERYRQSCVQAWSAWVSPCCCVCLLAFFLFADWQAPFTYIAGLGIVNLLATAAIAGLLLAPASNWAQLLRTNMVAWVGRLSYGLYLWHYPVYRAIQDAGMGPDAMLIFGPPLSLLLASLSYYGVERPIVRYKRTFRPRSPLC